MEPLTQPANPLPLHALAGSVVVSGADAPTIMIRRCGGCDRRLDWPAPKAGYWAAPVACPECGRWCFTEARNRTTLALKPGFEPTSDELRRRAAQADDAAPHGLGEDGAHSLNLPVIVVPLSEAIRPTDEAVAMTLASISDSGCRLLDPHGLRAGLLLLDFALAGCPGTQTLGRVAWRKTTADGQLVGCVFLRDADGGLPVQ